MRFEGVCAKILAAVSVLIFSVIVYQSFLYSYVDTEGWLETPVLVYDNIIVHSIVFFMIVMGAGFLSTKLEKLADKFLYVALGVLCLFSLVFCFIYLYGHTFLPYGDQAYVLEAAWMFEQGDYSFMHPTDGYIGMCPHQRGLVLLYVALSKITGAINYRDFQHINICMLPLLIVSGFYIVRILGEKKNKYMWLYLFVIATCVPMYVYTPYLYGETISTSLSLFTIWMVLGCVKEFKWHKVVLAGLAIGIAIQLRSNSCIVLIALIIFLLFKMLAHKKGTIALLASLIIGGLGAYMLVEAVFEPIEYTDEYGIPAITYVAMGLNDDPHLGMGWFNGINISIYADEAGGDLEMAKELSLIYMTERWSALSSEEGGIFDFYCRKLFSQWNTPLYSSLSLNANNIYTADGWLVTAFYSEEGSAIIKAEANEHQFIVYVCFLVFLIGSLFKKNTRLDIHLVTIVVFGGILFSLLWEAKARYIYPYYIFMQVYTPFGITILYEKCKALIKCRYPHKGVLEE